MARSARAPPGLGHDLSASDHFSFPSLLDDGEMFFRPNDRNQTNLLLDEKLISMCGLQWSKEAESRQSSGLKDERHHEEEYRGIGSRSPESENHGIMLLDPSDTAMNIAQLRSIRSPLLDRHHAGRNISRARDRRR